MSTEEIALQQEVTFDASPQEQEEVVAEEGGGLTFGAAGSDSEDSGDEGAAAQPSSSNIDFAAIAKHDAKNVLDKKAYKQWKKWYKERKSSKLDDKKKDKEDKKKKEKEAHQKKKERKSKEKKSKRDTEDTDDNYGVQGLNEVMTTGGGGVRGTIHLKVAGSKKLKAPELDSKRASDAKDLVDSMRRAANADTIARQNRMPPLNRLAIRSAVVTVAQRPYMHQWLCEVGFLDQISAWLCDASSKELGPLDLRTSALDLLLGFDFEGVTSVRKKQLQAALQRKGGDGDVDIGYEGISSDQLRGCDLGGAVNFIRTAPQETRDNRIKATTLLERMSRTFHDEHDDEDVVGGGAKWPMMDDRAVASPFESLKTRTEAFMTACIRVDPEDPNSYHKQPPKRFPRSFISGLAGVGRQKRDRDLDDN